MKNIEKPWCVYGSMALDVGMVVQEGGSPCCYILYAECQKYPAQCWDNKYVRRFDTYNDAIHWLAEHTEDTAASLRQIIKDKFPSQFNKSNQTIKETA